MEIFHIGIRVMDEIVKPLRDIQMDDTEYTCLKAIVFFDPSKKLKKKIQMTLGSRR